MSGLRVCVGTVCGGLRGDAGFGAAACARTSLHAYASLLSYNAAKGGRRDAAPLGGKAKAQGNRRKADVAQSKQELLAALSKQPGCMCCKSGAPTCCCVVILKAL